MLERLTQISSALLTPTLAIIGAVILIKQYLLQKLRWRLDLYDKRYPVFLSTMKYITSITQTGDVTNDELTQFLRNSKDREFLFGNDVKEFLDKLYNKGVDLHTANSVLENTPVGGTRNKLVNPSGDIFNWFTKQFKVSKSIFSKSTKSKHFAL